jgi:hypothetical protein
VRFAPLSLRPEPSSRRFRSARQRDPYAAAIPARPRPWCDRRLGGGRLRAGARQQRLLRRVPVGRRREPAAAGRTERRDLHERRRHELDFRDVRRRVRPDGVQQGRVVHLPRAVDGHVRLQHVHARRIRRRLADVDDPRRLPGGGLPDRRRRPSVQRRFRGLRCGLQPVGPLDHAELVRRLSDPRRDGERDGDRHVLCDGHGAAPGRQRRLHRGPSPRARRESGQLRGHAGVLPDRVRLHGIQLPRRRRLVQLSGHLGRRAPRRRSGDRGGRVGRPPRGVLRRLPGQLLDRPRRLRCERRHVRSGRADLLRPGARQLRRGPGSRLLPDGDEDRAARPRSLHGRRALFRGRLSLRRGAVHVDVERGRARYGLRRRAGILPTGVEQPRVVRLRRAGVRPRRRFDGESGGRGSRHADRVRRRRVLDVPGGKRGVASRLRRLHDLLRRAHPVLRRGRGGALQDRRRRLRPRPERGRLFLAHDRPRSSG